MNASKILIVEDEPVVARDTAECLEGLGYEVLGPVASGEEAVAAAESGRPDVVLMDIRLRGEMDGIEAASQIRSRFGTVVVFLTAFTDRDLLKRAREVGVSGYLTKPYEERELYATLEMTLAQSEAERARKQAEEALRRSEHQYRELVEGTSDLITKVDGEGRFIFVNLAAEKVLGVANSGCLGKRAFDFVHPDDRERTVQWFGDCIKQRLREASIENRHVNATTGETFFLLWTSVFRYDDDGNVLEVDGIAHDVTARKQAEESLAEQERYYRTLLFSLHDDILVIDRDYRITDINNSALHTLGSKREDVIGRRCYEVSHGLGEPCNNHGEQCGLRTVFETGEYCHLRHEHVATDGKKVQVDLLMSPLKDANGAVTHVVEAARDITNLVETEKELRHAETFMHAVIDDLPVGVLAAEPPDGRLILTNNETERIIGLPREHLCGLSGDRPEEVSWEMFHLDGTPWPVEELPLIKAVQRGEKTHNEELLMSCADGVDRVLLCNATPVRNGDGDIIRAVSTILDITDRKRAEEELRDSESQFRSLFEQTGDYILVLELQPDGPPVIVDANEAAIEKHGFSRDEFIGKPISDLDDELNRQLVAERVNRLVAGEHIVFETTHARKDGSVFPVEVSAKLLDVGEGPSRIISIERDITERNRIEANTRRMEKRFRSIFDKSFQFVLVLDPSGTILEMNALCFAVCGSLADQSMGKPFWEALWLSEFPDVVEKTKAAVKLVQEGKVVDDEVRFIDKDSQVHNGTRIFSPIMDDSGELEYIAVVGLDLTERKRTEEQLREHERVMSDILEDTLSGYWDWNIPEDVEYLSPALKKMFGYEEHELPNTPESWQKLIFPEDLTGVLEVFDRHVKTHGREPFYNEVRYRHKDGSTITVICAGRVIEWAEDGSPIRMVGCHVDITDRKQAEDTLRASEERFRLLFERSPLAYQSLDDDGYIVEANHAWLDLLGYSRDEVVGQWFGNFLSPESVPDFRRNFPCFKEAGETHGIEFQMMLKDGTHHTITFDGRIGYDAKGNFQQTHCILHDVTQDRLREQEIADLAKFPSENPYPVLRIASDGTIIHANPAATRLLTEYGPADRRAPDDWLSCTALAMESGEIVNREFQYGEETYAFHFTSLAEVEYVNVYGIDITERKRMESQYRQAQKMEAVGRLAAGVAHDFNNQLQVILGYCDMLMMDRQPGDPLWDPIVQVRQAADRARSTTSHLLAFSRRQILEPELVDVGELLHDMEKPVGRMIGEDVKLVIAVPPGVRPLLIDKSGLHQAIMNLAVNARDAMPDGGKLVIQGSNLTLDHAQAPNFPEAGTGDYVLLEITDSGVGMDAETLEHLFEPFFTTKEQGKGTGLGMPMVQGFVGQSDGFVRVDSQPGEGTRVQILLPQAPSDSQPEDADQALLRIEKATDKAMIMVVEDEQGVRSYLARLLRHAGYKVQVAAMPSEAMELIQGDGPMPELVVSDVIMPEMRGDQLAQKMLSVCEELRFLFISGYGNIEVGGHDIMRKPFKTEDLLERIRKLLLKDQ